MNRTQTELFTHTSTIAERKMREARAMQSHEARDMILQAFGALIAKLRRPKARKAKV